MPLITRRTFPPGGFPYYQPQSNWSVPNPLLDFDSVVQQIAQHRAANPRFGLTTDVDAIAAELDEYTCIRLRYDPNYCSGGPSPKSSRPLPSPSAGQSERGKRSPVVAVKKLSQGVGVLLDWIGSGGKTVDQAQANHRAEICAKCPKNLPGDWLSHFTGPAAAKIKSLLEVKHEMELKTPHDEQLRVCAACLCHMQTKVWVPLSHILKKLTPSMQSELDSGCWILSELKSLYEGASALNINQTTEPHDKPKTENS